MKRLISILLISLGVLFATPLWAQVLKFSITEGDKTVSLRLLKETCTNYPSLMAITNLLNIYSLPVPPLYSAELLWLDGKTYKACWGVVEAQGRKFVVSGSEDGEALQPLPIEVFKLEEVI